MKGATADPSVSTINPPNTIITKKRGSSQNFFLTLTYVKNSFINEIIKMLT